MSPERWLAWLARIAKVLCWPFVRFDIAGAEQLNHEFDAAIVATDHRSMFDIVAGLIVLHHYQRYPRVLIEQAFVKGRWTGPFARAIGAIPVDRANRTGTAFAAAVATLDAGATVLLLPEGRLHWDPDAPLTTGPAATGVSRMAAASGVPVVAAGMVGTERVWPAGKKLPRPRLGRRHVVTVRVSDAPVAFDDPDDHRARTEAVMADVRRLMADASEVTEAARQVRPLGGFTAR